MPTFELRFIASPEDMPGALISVDMRTQRNDVTVASGAVVEVLNRGPASLRKFRDGDSVHTKWWNAVAQGPATTLSPAAFGNAGGIAIPTGAKLLLTSMMQFPETVAGEYTLVFVVDGAFTGATQQLVLDGAGLRVKLNDGSGNVAWSDAGAGGVGPATINGPQIHVVRFGKADPLASPTTNWRRNCVQIHSGAYTPTNFGVSASLFGGANDFVGTAGRLLFFNRRLLDVEVAWLESVLPPQFGLMSILDKFVAPATVDWLDPAEVDLPSRINPTFGHPLRSVRVTLSGPGHVLVEAVENAGAGNEQVLSLASGYVPWYVEWPRAGAVTEPPTLQDANVSGVCRLPLVENGHYQWEMYRPSNGAVIANFDVAFT